MLSYIPTYLVLLMVIFITIMLQICRLPVPLCVGHSTRLLAPGGPLLLDNGIGLATDIVTALVFAAHLAAVAVVRQSPLLLQLLLLRSLPRMISLLLALRLFLI